MIADFPVALILILGAALVPLLRGQVRFVYSLLLPVASFAWVLALPQGEFAQFELLGQTLTAMRVDRLSLLFSYIFLIACLLGVIYAQHVEDRTQQTAALVYAGGAIGAVFAGDLLTLFVYWELTAISSVVLIWARRQESILRSGLIGKCTRPVCVRAGMRYFNTCENGFRNLLEASAAKAAPH